MKKLIILVIPVSLLIMSCTELADMEARRQRRIEERGVECRYNKRGGVENCRYAN